MKWRQQVKRFVYGALARFKYFGEVVYFPRGSLSFRAACEQGTFEADNVAFLVGQVRPESLVFDVGANIGLMAIPLLRSCSSCKVISFEPSPNALPFLRKTIARSSAKSRWTLIEKGVSDFEGETSFSISDRTLSLFDGIRDTHRGGTKRAAEIPVTTLDSVWKLNSRPRVSLIKCDVEGAELAVLRGARECLENTKPAVLIEWNKHNLEAYECPVESILSFCEQMRYRLFALPAYVEIGDATALALQMTRTENFALLPRL